MTKTIAVYGGGFKPPTKGHFEVVQKALEQNKDIDEFIIFVGGKERDGISQAQSIMIWEIYANYLPLKVDIKPSKSPIADVMSASKNNPQDIIYFVIGGREGHQGDIEDVAKRTKDVEIKYPNMKIKYIETKDSGISGTSARKAVQVSPEEFYKYIPSELSDKEKEEVYNIVRPGVPEPLMENATYSSYIDYKQNIKDLTKYLLQRGENIVPLPKVKFINSDKSNAENFFGKTAYYDPENKVIVLYTEGRHPKDIVRSFSHEIIHHKQNLENRLGHIKGTDTNEDDHLQELEKEAYLDGNINFRNWTDSLSKNQLNEDPDNSVNAGGWHIDFQNNDAHPFGYYDGELWVGNPGGTHFQLGRIIKIALNIPEEQRLRREDMEYPGRIWTKSKVISFWVAPESQTKLQQIIKDLNQQDDEYNIDDSWSVDIGDEDAEPKLIKTSDYKSAKQNFDPGKAHILSPLLKGKKEPPEGSGSKKPYPGHKVMTKAESDWLIKKARGMDENLDESPDRVYLKGGVLTYRDSDAVPFGYYKGKLYMGNFEGTHYNIGNKILNTTDEKGEELDGGERGIKRQHFDYPGRLWVDHKVISFWKAPENDSKLKKIIKDLNIELTKLNEPNINNSWEIEIIDPEGFEDSYVIPISSYKKAGEDFDIHIPHELSPLEKAKIRKEKGITDYVKPGTGSKKSYPGQDVMTRAQSNYLRARATGMDENLNEDGVGNDPKAGKFWGLYYNIFEKLLENPDRVHKFLVQKLSGESKEALEYFYKNFFKNNTPTIAVNEINFKRLENTLDDKFAQYGIDTAFTKHFKERVIQRHISEEDIITLIDKILDKYGDEVADLDKGDNRVFTDLKNLVDLAVVDDGYNDEYLKDLVFKTAYKRWSPKEPEFRTNASSPKLKVAEKKDPFGLNQYVRELAQGLEEELKESKFIVYCDMDGVLTDFDKRFMDYSDGIMPSEFERNFGKDKFWEIADAGGVGFWVGMSWMPDGKELWRYINQYNPTLLSSPSRSNMSRLGKRLWVKKQLPGTKLILAQAQDKQNYAGKNKILIDDRTSNIEEWRSQGGIGILHTSAANTINQLKQLGL